MVVFLFLVFKFCIKYFLWLMVIFNYVGKGKLGERVLVQLNWYNINLLYIMLIYVYLDDKVIKNYKEVIRINVRIGVIC